MSFPLPSRPLSVIYSDIDSEENLTELKLTYEQYLSVRYWRNTLGYTWRRLAEEFAFKFPGILEPITCDKTGETWYSQEDGAMLCDLARITNEWSDKDSGI